MKKTILLFACALATINGTYCTQSRKRKRNKQVLPQHEIYLIGGGYSGNNCKNTHSHLHLLLCKSNTDEEYFLLELPGNILYGDGDKINLGYQNLGKNINNIKSDRIRNIILNAVKFKDSLDVALHLRKCGINTIALEKAMIDYYAKDDINKLDKQNKHEIKVTYQHENISTILSCSTHLDKKDIISSVIKDYTSTKNLPYPSLNLKPYWQAINQKLENNK